MSSLKTKNIKFTLPSWASSFLDKTAIGKSEVFKLNFFKLAEVFQELPWEGCYDLACSNRKYSRLEINSALLEKPGRYKLTKSVSFCSKHKTQINNPKSQPCILYSGLNSLNKSIFPVIKMWRCVLPVTERSSQFRYFIFYFLWGASVKIHKHNQSTQHLSHPHMMPFIAFWNSSYLTTFVPFRIIWTSTA